MSDTSTNLGLPYLASAQAQKHVTLNEALLRLDALVQCTVKSRTVSTEPGSPADGDVYILPPGKTGTHWAGMANHALAYYRDGLWEQLQPREGWRAFVQDTDSLIYYTGAAWSGMSFTVSATDKVLGRVSAGGGAIEEIAFTDQAQALCDDASFADMRTTLGLGTAATANTGTSGAAVPLLNGANTWSGNATFNGGLTAFGTATFSNLSLHYGFGDATGWKYGPSTNGNTPGVFYVINASNVGAYLISGNASWSSTSDARMKDVQAPLRGALDAICALAPVVYALKDDASKRLRTGLVAQEVEAVIPGVVDPPTRANGQYALRYGDLVPYLIAAVQELRALVEGRSP
ncbi:MAG: DUF2793 domain-containing protein [Hyphomonadaceae bacterium]